MFLKILPQLSLSTNSVKFNASHPMFRYEVPAAEPAVIEKIKKASTIVVVGMGGSILPLKAFVDAFQLQRRIFLLDTVDPLRFAEIRRLPQPLFCVASKSGETLEIKALLSMLLDAGFGDRILMVTDPEKGFLRQIVNEKKLPSLPIPADLGGRFTNFSVFHRALLEAQGVDFNSMLEHANKTVNKLKADPFILENLYQQLFEPNRNALILWAYGDRVHGLACWIQQVIAESLGKRAKDGTRKGILPVVLKGPQDQHSVLQLLADGPQDKALWFFSFQEKSSSVLSEALNILLESTFKTFEERLSSPETAQPISRFDLASTESFVEAIVTIQAFVEYAGGRLQVNAFDQPGVERGKEIAKELEKKPKPKA
jgi:glucose-6-phosphate isomerase